MKIARCICGHSIKPNDEYCWGCGMTLEQIEQELTEQKYFDMQENVIPKGN